MPLNHYSSLPCSNCKHLVHQKCCKVPRNSFNNIDSIKVWMCLSCSISIFPFHQILNIDLTDEFTGTVTTALSTVHINDLRENFNLNNILGHAIEDDRNEVISLQAFNKCDYYDALEFNKLLSDYSTSDRSLKVFHTNIRSMGSNHNNLINKSTGLHKNNIWYLLLKLGMTMWIMQNFYLIQLRATTTTLEPLVLQKIVGVDSI